MNTKELSNNWNNAVNKAEKDTVDIKTNITAGGSYGGPSMAPWQ